jgi:hypothetical protein
MIFHPRKHDSTILILLDGDAGSPSILLKFKASSIRQANPRQALNSTVRDDKEEIRLDACMKFSTPAQEKKRCPF